MTTTKQKLVGAKQGRGARRDPPWRRLRSALADIETGIFPARTFDYHRLPSAWLDDPRIQSRIRIAEAACQRNAIVTIQNAGTRQTEERQLPADGGRARVSARAWETKDWRAPAWLLERRFPAEYGSQQPTQVAQTVVDVLTALAALRQQPASLEDLRHRPQLPAPLTVEAAVEAGGTTGTP